MPKINDAMIEALEKAIESYGNISQLAKKMGIAHSTILFWMSGKTKNISGRLWITRIRPVLLPFMDRAKVREMLPQKVFYAADVAADYDSGMMGNDPAFDLIGYPSTPVYKVNEANIISFEQLADYDPTLDLIDKYVKDNSEKRAIFAHEVKHGYFALEIDEKNTYGRFPVGVRLLVAGMELAQNSDTVIAKIRKTGEIVIRTYTRNGNNISLTTDEPNAKSYEWDSKKSPGFLFWMYPIIEANLNLREETSVIEE